MNLILDTSVIIDIVLESRPRHPEAIKLGDYIKRNGIFITLPTHALFEIHSAMKLERMNPPTIPSYFFTEDSPLRMKQVYITQEFFEKYFSPDLPYMKAADLIFVSMAKVDGIPLITEDLTQYKKAKEGGVKVYRIKEFLDISIEAGRTK